MSEYLDRKQVIELYEKHHSHLATYVYEFGQELKQLPITTIPVAELDTTNDFAKWIDVNGDGSIMKCSKCGEEVCCKNNNFCPNCGASMSANDRQVKGKLNSEIENLKSEIVPDYRDGWRLKEGEAE